MTRTGVLVDGAGDVEQVPVGRVLRLVGPADATDRRVVVRKGGITRRGRLVLLALGSVVIACVFVLGRSTASSASETGPGPTTVVGPGQTLWSIAHDVDPGSDPRRTVQRLAALNHLDPSMPLQVGQVLVLPRHP